MLHLHPKVLVILTFLLQTPHLVLLLLLFFFLFTILELVKVFATNFGLVRFCPLALCRVAVADEFGFKLEDLEPDLRGNNGEFVDFLSLLFEESSCLMFSSVGFNHFFLNSNVFVPGEDSLEDKFNLKLQMNKNY